jgi:hypothetical protein
MKVKGVIDVIAFVLMVIGGLNWGLYGLFQLDIVNMILGAGLIADIVYTLVGVSALYAIGSVFMKESAVM